MREISALDFQLHIKPSFKVNNEKENHKTFSIFLAIAQQTMLVGILWLHCYMHMHACKMQVLKYSV